MLSQTVLLLNPFTLVLKEETMHVNLEEYEVSYYHQSPEIRQVVLEHTFENTVILQGPKNNLVIRYLKQFMMS